MTERTPQLEFFPRPKRTRPGVIPPPGGTSRPGLTLKALSIRQPYAYAILHLRKPVENWTWYTAFRGRFLIHASLTFGDDERRETENLVEHFGVDIPDDLPLGGIVGEAELVDVVTCHPSEWFEGPFGFVLKNVRPLPFYRVPGKQRFFDVAYPFAQEGGKP